MILLSCQPFMIALILEYNTINQPNLLSNNFKGAINLKASNNNKKKIRSADITNNKKNIRLANIDK